MEAKDTLYITNFPVVVQSDCPNIHHIYPLKQKAISDIYDIVSGIDGIRKVIIFGSSVTARCHIGSDLDICIDMDSNDGMKIFEVQKQVGEACGWNCDIKIYNNLGNRLKEIIEEKGVVIYEQFIGKG